jgi:hypothetical protein
MTISLRTGKWPTEIVDLPIKDGDYPVRHVSSPEGKMMPLSALKDHPVHPSGLGKPLRIEVQALQMCFASSGGTPFPAVAVVFLG